MEAELRKFEEIHAVTGKRKFIIEGQVSGADISADLDLSVAALSDNEVLGCDRVNNGRYRIEFMGDKSVPVELRLLPTPLARKSGQMPPGFTANIGAGYFETVGEDFRARFDIIIPEDLLLLFFKTYRVRGVVFVWNRNGFQPLRGCRIDFYEVDPPAVVGVPTEQHLGAAVSDLYGRYTFEFKFRFPVPVYERAPDLKAKISQFVDGSWHQVHESAVDENISENFFKIYYVPEDQIFPHPPEEEKPATGFRGVSLGLLPLDSTHIVNGYATAQPLDPERIRGIRHQPFCGTLRVFGFFAETPRVVKYKVQFAGADENAAIGPWVDLTDPLHNREWSSSGWAHRVLGPDGDNYYRNVDIEPKLNWHEHALKFAWNTANLPNGYYALRIIGEDNGGNKVQQELPIMRVDNTPPELSFEAIETSLGAVSDCGHVSLPTITAKPKDRWIRVKVTAYDPQGHMLKYTITGSRGKSSVVAGAPVEMARPVGAGIWLGELNSIKEFVIDALPAEMSECPSVAYNLELYACGSATDCYSVTVNSQERRVEANLVVTEVKNTGNLTPAP